MSLHKRVTILDVCECLISSLGYQIFNTCYSPSEVPLTLDLTLT